MKDAGLLDPDFFLYQEDADLGWRIRLRGWTVLRAPESVVYHKYHFSSRPEKFYYLERNRYLMIFKNYKIATLLLFAPALLCMQCGMALYAIAAGWRSQEWRACAWFLSLDHWRSLWRARRQVQASRHASDAKILSLYKGTVDFEGLRSTLWKKAANPLFNLYWKIIQRCIFW